MKNLFSVLIIFSIAAISCKYKTKAAEDNATTGTTADQVNILGSYVGAFGNNKITVLISRLSGDTISGRSIVGGNDRPFTGTLYKNADSIHIRANEPGDQTHDGKFNFTIEASQPNKLSGTWSVYKTDMPNADASKTFSLDKKAFVYKTDVGEYPIASERLMADSDVNNLLKEELEQMRNEIYARHGYCFSRKDTRQQFENYDWYIPNSVDVRNDLTEIEKKNIVLIKKYEKYAKDYGYDFGR